LNAIVHFHEFTSLVKRRARSLPEPEGRANAALRDRGSCRRKYRTRDVLSHRDATADTAMPRLGAWSVNGICTACDSRACQGAKLALSRTAQRDVFALWVLAHGAIGRRLSSIAAMGFQLVAALPEDECIGC
jgi:hypothetical protein